MKITKTTKQDFGLKYKLLNSCAHGDLMQPYYEYNDVQNAAKQLVSEIQNCGGLNKKNWLTQKITETFDVK